MAASSDPNTYHFDIFTDLRFVKHLERKILGNPTRVGSSIPDVDDIYQFSPQQLSEMYLRGVQHSMYFFTSKHDNQRLRPAAGGYWEHTGFDALISPLNSVTRGFRKSFIYYEGKQGSGIRTDWMLHECRLINIKRMEDTDVTDLVLCKIYKPGEPLPRRR